MMDWNTPTLPPDVFEAVVTAFAETLIRHYREKCSERPAGPIPVPSTATTAMPSSPWLKVDEAASRVQCGEKTIYAEVRAGRLRAVRVGGRRSLASAVSAVLFLGAIWAVLSAASVVRVGAGVAAVARRVLWCYAGLFSLSALASLASMSLWERFLMTPVAVLLAACCVFVALPATHRS
jgi:excisionase family DNA binding protein